MACLITITGTSGLLEIRYTDGGVPSTIRVEGEGGVYLPDAVLAADYTVLSGDLDASSACTTLTEVPLVLNKFTWEIFDCLNPYQFNGIIADAVTSTITNTIYHTLDLNVIIEAINALGNDNIKAVAFKLTVTGSTWVAELIVRTLGVDDLQLQLQGTASTEKMIINSTVVGSIPVDFTEIEICTSP
jgi:hypothetical protein